MCFVGSQLGFDLSLARGLYILAKYVKVSDSTNGVCEKLNLVIENQLLSLLVGGMIDSPCQYRLECGSSS